MASFKYISELELRAETFSVKKIYLRLRCDEFPGQGQKDPKYVYW